jgi:dipeptidyl aminopeptidase/acylaminoacyl peptidase
MTASRLCLRHTLQAAMTVMAFAGVQSVMAQSAGKRTVTVADMIRMTTIQGDDPWDEGVVRPAVYSADSSRFAFVIERGDLEKNTNISSIVVFAVKDVFSNPKPDTLVTFTSSSSRPAITGIRWLGDTAIAFIGERVNEKAQLWTVNIKSRDPRALTSSPVPVTGYDVTPTGERILVTSDQIPDSTRNADRAARGFLVTQEVRDLLRGAWDVSPDQDEAKDLFILSPRDRSMRKMVAAAIGDCYGQAKFSSTGRFALRRCIRRDDLADWKAYIPADAANWRMGYVDVLFDLEGGRAIRLLDLPAVGGPTEWSPDGTLIVITNSLLPLSSAEVAAGKPRPTERAAVIVDPVSRELYTLLKRDSLEFVRWSADSKAIVLRSMQKDKTELAFKKEGNAWVAADPKGIPGDAAKPAPPSGKLEIVVEQDLNTPPRIVAKQGDKKTTIFDPNPWFSELAFGREELFKWKTTDGEWTGGLYYPVGYEKGKKYPLVIQTHGFAPDKFQIAGYGITGYAGQALAGNGIMVLQVGDGPPGVGGKTIATKEENPYNMRALEGAIDALDKLGLIDRNKVALEGWSRTCFHVRYFMVNSSYPVAAALISDGYDASYVRWVIDTNSHNELEAITGGPPIGENIRVFQERIPTMRPDRFKAPVRIEAISFPGGGGPLTQWELYALLRRLNKPVEMVYYPRGEHSLRMPWERMTSQGGAVDWFRFWLKGEEDPDPKKADQYKRWRAMQLQTKQVSGN